MTAEQETIAQMEECERFSDAWCEQIEAELAASQARVAVLEKSLLEYEAWAERIQTSESRIPGDVRERGFKALKGWT